MNANRVATLAIEAAPPVQALSALVLGVLAEISGPGAPGPEPDRATRLAAEAADPASLVAALVDQLCAIGEEFDATPVSARIDGFRALADGFRAWGVVGLSYEQPAVSSTAYRLGPPTVTHTGTDWEIRVSIAIT